MESIVDGRAIKIISAVIRITNSLYCEPGRKSVVRGIGGDNKKEASAQYPLSYFPTIFNFEVQKDSSNY